MVEQVHWAELIADFDAGNVKLQATANHHGTLGVAHAFKPQKLLVETASLLQAVTLESAVGEHKGFYHRILVTRVDQRLSDDFRGNGHGFGSVVNRIVNALHYVLLPRISRVRRSLLWSSPLVATLLTLHRSESQRSNCA